MKGRFPVYSRALRYIRPYWLLSLGGILLTMAGIALNLLKPWPFKYIVDGVLAPQGTPEALKARQWLEATFGGAEPATLILWLCLALVVVSLLWGAINMAANYCFIQVGLRALLKLRTDLYSCLQALPLKFHDARRSADSSFRVAYDSQSIQTLYNRGFAGILGSAVTLLSALGIMFAMNWPLTLASLAVLPCVGWAIAHYADRVRRQSTAIQESESDLLAVTQEGLSQIRMVHAFGREGFEVRQFRRRASRSLEANLRLNMTSVSSTLVVGTLMTLGTALMYYVGSLQVLRGALSLGDLLVFASYLLMLYQPLEQLSYTAWALEGAAAGAARCFEVLDSQNDVPEMPGAHPLAHGRGTIAFRNVTFGYDPAHLILKGIHLEIAPGEQVAFVGGTGAGKSTLLSLVPRFYDPTSGTVTFDGQDLRQLKKKSLRAQIGMVLQDTLLFSTTIRENISYGRPGATFDEIIEAAKRAQAHDFINAMPGGYDAPVGERGSHLSVGQRQRIGIARAFLKDAPILLLDEPTSALDPATESAIMETLAELMKGRTTLIITHRLATVHDLGRIVVLEHGTIAEDGPGRALLARGGTYARLYAAGKYGEE
jgi:ATP-binding cassette subfamily B protein/subfamily B ATP-binding cassette protein MsbA